MTEFAPSLIFFIAFFVAFAIIEFLIVALLNVLAKHYWAFFIDRVISARVHYGKRIRLAFILLFLLVIVWIFYATPLWSIYQQSTPVMKWFALALVMEVALIYYFTSRKIVRLSIERKIHLAFFSLISLAAYVFIIILAYSSYGNYQKFVREGILDPARESTRDFIDEQANQMTVQNMYQQYKEGGCQAADLRQASSQEQGMRQYVHIGDDPEYQDGQADDENKFLVGAECEKGDRHFWRTENGQWYEVINTINDSRLPIND